MKRAALLFAIAGLASCGTSEPDPSGAGSNELPLATTTSVDPDRRPASTTTTAVVDEATPAEGFDVSDVTIPPPDAYPIITPDQAKSDDLEPGLYWIRGDDEADWPAQCLPEVIVYATPDDGQELADDEFDDLMDEAPQGEEEAALAEEIRQARTQRKFELLREFCSEFVTREVPPVVNATDPDSPAETLAP